MHFEEFPLGRNIVRVCLKYFGWAMPFLVGIELIGIFNSLHAIPHYRRWQFALGACIALIAVRLGFRIYDGVNGKGDLLFDHRELRRPRRY